VIRRNQKQGGGRIRIDLVRGQSWGRQTTARPLLAHPTLRTGKSVDDETRRKGKPEKNSTKNLRKNCT